MISVESLNTHNFTKITTTDLSTDRFIPKMGLVAQHEGHYYSMLAPIDCFGEIICALLLEPFDSHQMNGDDRILLLKVHLEDACTSKLFHIESIIKLINKLNHWKIMIQYLPERGGL